MRWILSPLLCLELEAMFTRLQIEEGLKLLRQFDNIIQRVASSIVETHPEIPSLSFGHRIVTNVCFLVL